MSWSVCDPIRRAETAARGLTHTERLAVAWRLVEGVDDPEDFRQLDMFLGMVSAHCDEVRLNAALRAAEGSLHHEFGFFDLEGAREHNANRKSALAAGKASAGFVDPEAARRHALARKAALREDDQSGVLADLNCASMLRTASARSVSPDRSPASACPSANPQTSSTILSSKTFAANTAESSKFSVARNRVSRWATRVSKSLIRFLLGWSNQSTSDHRECPAAVAADAPLRVRGGGDTSLQATTTHEQNTPAPGPGPRRLRAALARAGDALSRSDDTWIGSIVGALCFAAAAVIGVISAGVLS